MDFLLVLIEFISLGVTAEALRANIDWKSVLLKAVCVSFGQTFRYKGMSISDYFCTDR